MQRQLVKVIASLLFVFAACKDELIILPVYHQTVFLDTILVEPTEIDLHLTTSDSVHTPSTLFQVRRDSVIIFSRFVLQNDTVIVDTGLLPSHVYKYKALRLKNSVRTDSSKLLSLRTMDTTSHDFVWEVDTLGDGYGSYLKDVAIVNDTCAYAVGALYVRDSVGRYNTDPYNLALWNGRMWTLKQVYYPWQGQYFIAPFTSVFAFSSTDLWVGSNQPQHWDGNDWKEFDLGSDVWNGWIDKIWGISSVNLFMVGAAGAIAHFDGTTWQKMDSGTDVDLTDVWGSPDGSIVWACGYDQSKFSTILLKNDHGNGWTISYANPPTTTSIRYDSLSGVYTSVFTVNPRRIFVASYAGLYEAYANTRGEAKRISYTTTYFDGFPNRMRGNSANDLTIVGYSTFIAHYNGYSWGLFPQLMSTWGVLLSIAQQGNLVVAVGVSEDPINSRGLVYIGRR